MDDDLRPLILLDVDGVLNPWHRQGPSWLSVDAVCDGVTYPVLLNPEHGPMLLRLARETGAELVWATTWQDDANRAIGPLIGLPELPVIPVGSGAGALLVHPKTPPVADWVNRRPFVWFDDGLGRADRLYLKTHENVDRFRIIDIGPRKGLTERHLRQAADWLAAPRRPAEPSPAT
ncbi:HAD domain-containing protein [Nonomuraea candida]|uniref:HAD domain-containing protein n=1 Tax=Nonomuraea candida TaxID=359159 RepID=UPI0005B7E954|nr:HAD domain-containing protein [Nonomuraea candida]